MSRRRNKSRNTQRAIKHLLSPVEGVIEPHVPPHNIATGGADEYFLWDTIGTLGGGFTGSGRRSNAYSIGLMIAILAGDIKAKDLATAGMYLWRGQQRSWDIVAPGQHWFAQLLARRPNRYLTWFEFWRMVLLHRELTQNAYILKEETNAGVVTALLPVEPERVRERVTERGDLVYDVALSTQFDRAQMGATETVAIPARRMIHLKGRMWNSVKGMSNITLGSETFDLLGALQDYRSNLFGNDASTPLVFETEASLGVESEVAFQRLKNQLEERSRKFSAGAPLLLEAGLKAKSVAMNSRDAMSQETYESLVTQVCMLMDCPPQKIFALHGVKYDNQAELNAQYANSHLKPLALSVEETFRNSLLTEREWDTFWPEFDRQEYMATSLKELTTLLKEAGGMGLLTVDEMRERLPLGLNPLGSGKGGDERLVPVNMARIGPDGEVIGQVAEGQNSGAGQTPGRPPEDTEERNLRIVSRSPLVG